MFRCGRTLIVSFSTAAAPLAAALMDANDSPMLKPVLLSLPFDVTKNVLPAVVPVPISTTLVEIPTPPVSCLRKSLPSYVFIASSPNGLLYRWFLAN